MTKEKKVSPVVNFFKETKGELKKVIWPSLKQVTNNTLIVIVCILIVGAFISALDYLFTLGVNQLIIRGGGTGAIIGGFFNL